MTRIVIGLAAALTVTALASAQSPNAGSPVQKGAPLVLQGCVTTDPETGAYILRDAVDMRPPGAAASLSASMPVLYWFKDSLLLKGHSGRMVEIAARVDGTERSEAELKAARRGGALLVEIEGPGRDVKVSRGAIPSVSGTAGRKPGSDDVKLLLVKATIGHVKALDEACR